MNKNNNTKIADSIIKTDFVFAEHTTYRCGGKAKIAYFPKSVRQAIAVYDYLISQNTKFVVLGNGSNVLASDSGFDGAVICTKNLTGVYRTGSESIFCRAGTKISALLKYCIDNGLGGLEYLAGIPATLGGIVYMNGGACGKYVAENIINVKHYDGKISNISNKSCNFAYKYSTMQDINGLILGSELKICPTNSESVRQEIKTTLQKRSCLPGGASCGCVFKNKDGISAGKIIDEAGLKGLSYGSAQVSFKHANFIINKGSSSFDVRTLIDEIKRRVFELTGINLEEEVVYIGDF